MKLLVVLITYNRLAYTKRTLDAFRSTITVPHFLVIVDNQSTDGTREWLKDSGADLIIKNPDNYYPGKACNIGWEEGLKHYSEATHLMRLDNDMELLPGWDTKAKEYFKTIPELGQLGLDHEAIEHPMAKLKELNINGMKLNPWPGNVGGPNIISRAVWDRGIRYSEARWSHEVDIPTPQEDCQLSADILRAGYLMGHMTERLSFTFANQSNWSEYPDYYRKTMEERGYKNVHSWLWEDAHNSTEQKPRTEN
jgi:glycosyltransferase involved in cell wall biosynthesis